MKKTELEEFIEKLRKQKSDKTSPAFFIYKLLETAHPNSLAEVEKQAATALMAGAKFKQAFDEASKTAEGRAFVEEKFSEFASKVRGGIKEPDEEEDVES